MPLAVPGETRLPGGWMVQTELRDRRPDDPPRPGDRWTEAMDAVSVGASLQVRGRRPGDVQRPMGMGGRAKSIQDLFVDRRVPRTERDGWPLVVSRGDEILWVPGLRLAEAARITDGTRRVIVLTVTPPERLRA
jgi:tRNA(Ile)-lysidine synthase